MDNISYKSDIEKKAEIYTYVLPMLIQIALFVFQIVHGIISIWNIIATFMIIAIFVGAVKNAKHNKKVQDIKQVDKDIINGGSTIDYKTALKEKYNKKFMAIKAVVCVITLALSGLFFHMHNVKTAGLDVVNAKVVSQWGETTVVTTENDDGGISQSESEYVEIKVEYDFNGETKGAIVKAQNTSKIYIDEFKIYIDKQGEYKQDYGTLLSWKLEAIVFLSFAIAMLISLIFDLGVIFNAGVVFTALGLAFAFLAGGPIIENFFYNDIMCFISLFINIGIFFLLYQLVDVILKKRNSKNNTEKNN